MLSTDSALLMIVDVQGRLAQLVHDKEALFRNLRILIRGAQILQVPILWLEQNPAGLGPTVPEIANLMAGMKPIAKMSFSACGSAELMEALRRTGRSQILLAGIETHVCIYLTATDLLASGYVVEAVADAVSSRSPEHKQIGLNRIAALKGGITCVETVLFELLGQATGDAFKQVLKLLK